MGITPAWPNNLATVLDGCAPTPNQYLQSHSMKSLRYKYTVWSEGHVVEGVPASRNLEPSSKAVQVVPHWEGMKKGPNSL